MKNIDITIIIISYNTKAMTLACLASVFKETQLISFEVIVLDNASEDGSAQAIAQDFPQVHLIALQENLGFAVGNNEAAKYAKGEYLLLLNPDTVVLEGAIDKLYQFAIENESSHYGIYGGRTFFADGQLNPTSCWAKPTPWSLFCLGSGLTFLFPKSNFFNPEAYGNWQRNTIREVDIVTGCFFLLKKALWDEMNGFNPAFFMYGEEADLCLRVKAQKGLQPVLYPKAKIIHYGGASEKVRSGKLIKLFQAKILLMQYYWQPKWVGFGIAMLKLRILSRMFMYGLLVLLGFKNKQESYTTWKTVWKQRSHFININKV